MSGDTESMREAAECKLNEIRVFLTTHSLYEFKAALKTLGMEMKEADLAHKIGFTVKLLDVARELLREHYGDESERLNRTPDQSSKCH